jgi:tRNA (guanine37-N1)-methyltransferase
LKITFVSLFGELIQPYFEESILKRGMQRGLFEIEFLNPRDYTINKHRKTDDTVTGGGAGMVFSPQPLFDALDALKSASNEVKIIFLAPSAKRFNAKDAKRLAAFEHIALVCGRYEGFDERAVECFADELFSIGDFVLTGGELPALAVADAALRFVPGVLGSGESLAEESFEEDLLESPVWTKPAIFRGLKTPSTLLNGNHKEVAKLRKTLAAFKTAFFRPDLLSKS